MWKNKLLLVKTDLGGDKQRWIKTTPSFFLSFPRLNFTFSSHTLLPPHTWAVHGDGKCVVVDSPWQFPSTSLSSTYFPLLQHESSPQAVVPLWHIHLLLCRVFNGLQGDNLPHHGVLQKLQGNLCSGTWNTSPLRAHRAVLHTFPLTIRQRFSLPYTDSLWGAVTVAVELSRALWWVGWSRWNRLCLHRGPCSPWASAPNAHCCLFINWKASAVHIHIFPWPIICLNEHT